MVVAHHEEDTVDDLTDLRNLVNSARQESNRRMARLSPRTARVLHDERVATDRLVTAQDGQINKLTTTVRLITNKMEILEKLVALQEIETGHPTQH